MADVTREVPRGGASDQPPPWSDQPQQQYDQTAPGAPPPAGASGNGFSIAAIALGILSILFFPIILGPVGIVLAAVGKSKRERLATAALIISIGGMVLGFALGILVFTSGGFGRR